VRLRLAFLILLAACTRELPNDAVQTVVDRSTPGKRVIFVGLDGADWRMLEPLMRDGTMPRLRAIVERAETRVLLTQHPPLSPLVWTSMMTGVSPLEHRILDFTRLHPRTHVQEPITSDERAAPALWNMARAGGKHAGVFGLWATYPAEEGVIVTDRDLPRDYVQATNVTHARATAWIREHKPDLAIVYFQGTDEIGHFTSGDLAKARDYFRRIDTIVEDYRVLAEELDAELVIASDHGFDWSGTHAESSTATATAAKWHRNEGIWIRWPHDPRRLADAHVAQVCATLLEILGLPNGEGLAEPIGGSQAQQSVNYRRYFQRVQPAGGAGDDEQIARLKALGYLSPAPTQGSSTRTPQSFNNEGLLLAEAKRIDEAERAFRAALALKPDYASAAQNLDALLTVRGAQRLKAHDCQGARADLRGVQHPTAAVWAGISASEGCLGNDVAAAEAYGRAAELDPELSRP
jgi:tetratricopeptide (TPR) repeat protein